MLGQARALHTLRSALHSRTGFTVEHDSDFSEELTWLIKAAATGIEKPSSSSSSSSNQRKEIISQGSPLQQFALPIVCGIAKGLRATSDRRARAELKAHAGVPFYLGLLAVVYWQEHAMPQR